MPSLLWLIQVYARLDFPRNGFQPNEISENWRIRFEADWVEEVAAICWISISLATSQSSKGCNENSAQRKFPKRQLAKIHLITLETGVLGLTSSGSVENMAIDLIRLSQVCLGRPLLTLANLCSVISRQGDTLQHHSKEIQSFASPASTFGNYLVSKRSQEKMICSTPLSEIALNPISFYGGK